MKHLISILLFVLPSGLMSQVISNHGSWIAYDKLIHFSYTMTFTTIPVTVLEKYHVKHYELKGAALVFGAGLAKEFLLDKNPSYKDITVNLAGCIAGVYLNRFFQKLGNKANRKNGKNELTAEFHR
jgi:hypothetical protein